MSMFDTTGVEDDYYLRQLDILKPSDTKAITIIGCGASGSAIGIFAGKVGVQSIHLIDGDYVEQHNLPNQYFGYEYLGRNKAEALKDEILRYTPSDMQPLVTYNDEMFDEYTQITTPIVMLCVDGLDTRRMIVERLRDMPVVEWVIETRMGARYYEVHSINMKDDADIDRWIETTYEESMDAPCTNRAVIFTVAIMSGHAVNWMTMLMRDEEVPYIMYDDVTNCRFKKVIGWRE